MGAHGAVSACPETLREVSAFQASFGTILYSVLERPVPGPYFTENCELDDRCCFHVESFLRNFSWIILEIFQSHDIVRACLASTCRDNYLCSTSYLFQIAKWLKPPSFLFREYPVLVRIKYIQ